MQRTSLLIDKTLVLTEEEIRRFINPDKARAAVAAGFEKLACGGVTQPPVVDLCIPEEDGETDIKGAHIHGSRYSCIKIASGFYRNPERGLPVGTGLLIVLSAQTGAPVAVLLDNGYLTNLRTAAAGAVAADLLARARLECAVIVGAGVQGRFQLEALLRVREPEQVLICDVDPDRAMVYAREQSDRHGIRVAPSSSLESAIRTADLIVTTTPSRRPYIRADWLRPGVHLTAVGADMPEKTELHPGVLASATKVVVDSVAQCRQRGELHAALLSGVVDESVVYAEIGEIVNGSKVGRMSEDEITVTDLTGVGVQDAAVATVVVEAALTSDR